MMRLLNVFLNGKHRNNAWVKIGNFDAYVRKGYHRIGSDVLDTFDIANILTSNEATKGNGDFRKLLQVLAIELPNRFIPVTCREFVTFKGVYLESVINDRLAASLPSMGFTCCLPPHSIAPPGFFLPFLRNF